MFTAEKYSKCLGNVVVESKAAQSSKSPLDIPNYVGYIPVPDGASGANAVLVQAYVDPAELQAAGLTFDDIAGKPLVTINESDLANASYDNGNLYISSRLVGGYSTPGQKLLNYGNYLIETAYNIRNAMIIPFDKNINVYIALTYFE